MEHIPRSKEKIIAEMLSCLKEPHAKSQIMYRARLCSAQLVPYMRYLQEKEMIRPLGNRLWIITELGREYLDQFKVIEEIMTESLQLPKSKLPT